MRTTWETYTDFVHPYSDITFCGRYAGGDAWSGYRGCAAETHDDSCNHFVATNPSKLKEVFYLINSVRVYQDGDGGGYQESILAHTAAQTARTPFDTKDLSTTTTELVTLPATMTHGANYGPYDPPASATTPIALASFYGKGLSAVTSNPGVVVMTTIITTTKVMTLPATLTGGDNYSPYDPSAASAKPIGTTIGGINYVPYDPSATSTKPTGTTMEDITNYTTIQTYCTSSKKAATISNRLTGYCINCDRSRVGEDD